MSDRIGTALQFAREKGMIKDTPTGTLWTPGDYYAESLEHRMLNVLEVLRYGLQRLTSGTVQEHKQFERLLMDTHHKERPWPGLQLGSPTLETDFIRHLINEADRYLELPS